MSKANSKYKRGAHSGKVLIKIDTTDPANWKINTPVPRSMIPKSGIKVATKLLTVDTNAKTVKGQKYGYLTGILYMTPADGASDRDSDSVKTLCPMADIAGCKDGCLGTAGRAGIAAGSKTFTTPSGIVLPDNSIQKARLRKAQLFITDQTAFMRQLIADIQALVKAAFKYDLHPAVRLNGTSDIRWEDIEFLVSDENKIPLTIFELFPDVQFYDYTKIPNRRRAMAVPNYHLTFSYSNRPEFAGFVQTARQTYGESVNLAVVFNGELPDIYMGRRVIAGDESDLRFLDAKGVIVGLTAKGRAKRDTSGFTV